MYGTFPITFAASNGVSPDASQGFTLTINEAPAITSANTATYPQNTPFNFTVTTTGYPIPSINEQGALPNGVTFVDNGDGTGTLSGTATQSNNFPIVFTASNGVAPTAIQLFMLSIQTNNVAPQITSANNATYLINTSFNFTVTTTGNPIPGISESGPLPNGVTFVNNGDGTGTLSGTATNSGTFPISFTASNGVSPDALQTAICNDLKEAKK